MKQRICLIFLSIVLSLTLLSCNDIGLANTVPSDPDSLPSEGDSSLKSYTEGEVLPSAYSTKNGWLLLDLGFDHGDSYDSIYDDQRADFDPDVEALKEKFLTVDFTQEDLEQLKNVERNSGCIQVADPRLLAPLKLPEGVALDKIRFFSRWSYVAAFEFQTSTADTFSLGRSFGANIENRSGVGGLGDRLHQDFLGVGEKVILDDGTEVAVSIDHFAGIYKKTIRSIKEENGRTYYITQSICFDSTSDEVILDPSAGNYVMVETFHEKHKYIYYVNDPTEECIKNILDYDPFTYLQVEY